MIICARTSQTLIGMSGHCPVPDKSASCQSIRPSACPCQPCGPQPRALAQRSARPLSGLSECVRFSVHPLVTWRRLNRDGKNRRRVTAVDPKLTIRSRAVQKKPGSLRHLKIIFSIDLAYAPAQTKIIRQEQRERTATAVCGSMPSVRVPQRHHITAMRSGRVKWQEGLSNTVLGRLQTTIGALIVCHSSGPRRSAPPWQADLSGTGQSHQNPAVVCTGSAVL